MQRGARRDARGPASQGRSLHAGSGERATFAWLFRCNVPVMFMVRIALCAVAFYCAAFVASTPLAVFLICAFGVLIVFLP